MKRGKPGHWLIPGGLTGGWKFFALWASTQEKADQKVWESGQGYTPDNWNPGKMSRVRSILSKGDVQAASTHSLSATSAGGVRRGPMPLRRRTTNNHKIMAAWVTMPEQEKVTSGRCIPKGRRTISLVSSTGQDWMDNRDKLREETI